MTNRLRAWARILVGFSIVAVVGVNLLAYVQASSMTRWSSAGERTAKPEALGLLGRLAVLTTGVNVPRPENLEEPGDIGLDFDRHYFPSESGYQIEAWHIPSSESEVMFVLFHGYASSKASMLPIARALNKLGYGSLLIDFFGSGGSTGRDTSLGVHEAFDVAASLSYSRQHWPNAKVILYGQSMGGSAVLRAIARHDVRPDGLILEATFDRLLATVKNRFHAMRVPGTPLAQLLVYWGGLSSGIDGFDHNPSEYSKAVHCPAVVFHGRHDRRVTLAQARSVYGGLNGWKRFTEFQDAGHGLVHFADLELWQANIAALVDEISREI